MCSGMLVSYGISVFLNEFGSMYVVLKVLFLSCWVNIVWLLSCSLLWVSLVGSMCVIFGMCVSMGVIYFGVIVWICVCGCCVLSCVNSGCVISVLLI